MTDSKIFRILSLFMIGVLFSACSSKDFKITGELTDFGTQNIRFIYYANDAINSIWVPTVDGKMEYTGTSQGNTVVEVYSRKNKLLTRFVIKNGDEIKFSGSVDNPFQITAEGNEISEKWTEFINDNASTFEKGDRKTIESLIEDQVNNNPDDPINAYLIAFNYANASNYKKAQELMALIPEENRDGISVKRIEAYCDITQTKITDNAVIAPFSMYSDKDSIESFNPSKHKKSLLYFSSHENKDRKDIVKQLKELTKKAAKLHIAEIGLENDSTVWHRAYANDSTKWKHYWALGGIMNGAVVKMGVTSSPYFIVLDSVGAPLYRGESIDSARKAIK